MLQPIVTQRLYQQVAENLRRQIQLGTVKPGERLPPEKVLAQQLGVSRPTVREAMIALEIQGLVDARVLIEGEVASEAALRASERDLDVLAESIDEMEAMLAGGEHSRSADQSFHVQIARASGNDVLASIVGGLWEGMFSPLFYKLSERTSLVSRQDAAIAEHKAIYAALRAHDPVGARSAMHHHLKRVRSVLSDAELSPD